MGKPNITDSTFENTDNNGTTLRLTVKTPTELTIETTNQNNQTHTTDIDTNDIIPIAAWIASTWHNTPESKHEAENIIRTTFPYCTTGTTPNTLTLPTGLAIQFKPDNHPQPDNHTTTTIHTGTNPEPWLTITTNQQPTLTITTTNQQPTLQLNNNPQTQTPIPQPLIPLLTIWLTHTATYCMDIDPEQLQTQLRNIDHTATINGQHITTSTLDIKTHIPINLLTPPQN
jgi:hypothetical protein